MATARRIRVRFVKHMGRYSGPLCRGWWRSRRSTDPRGRTTLRYRRFRRHPRGGQRGRRVREVRRTAARSAGPPRESGRHRKPQPLLVSPDERPRRCCPRDLPSRPASRWQHLRPCHKPSARQQCLLPLPRRLYAHHDLSARYGGSSTSWPDIDTGGSTFQHEREDRCSPAAPSTAVEAAPSSAVPTSTTGTLSQTTTREPERQTTIVEAAPELCRSRPSEVESDSFNPVD